MDRDVDQELAQIEQDGKRNLQIGLTQIIAIGWFFGRAHQLFSNEDRYEKWVEEKFGPGIYGISKNLMRLYKAIETGDVSIPVRLAAPHLLTEIGKPQDEELKAALTGVSAPGAGKEKNADYIVAKDLEHQLNKNKELRKLLDERELKIRGLLDDNSQLKEQLRKANRTNNQDEVDSLRKKISEKETEIVRLKREKYGNKKIHEKYMASLKTQITSFFLSEAVAFFKEYAVELSPSTKRGIANLLKTFLEEIKNFKKDLGI